jgi:hypothetical protein
MAALSKRRTIVAGLAEGNGRNRTGVAIFFYDYSELCVVAMIGF